jgi:hypothetical protein
LRNGQIVGFLGIFWEFSLLSWPPIRYPGCMGKNIRRTLTITITETWIIAWVTDDDHAVGAKRYPLGQAVTVIPNTPNTKEEPDESLQAAVNKTKSHKPSASARKKRPRNDRKTMT